MNFYGDSGQVPTQDGKQSSPDLSQRSPSLWTETSNNSPQWGEWNQSRTNDNRSWDGFQQQQFGTSRFINIQDPSGSSFSQDKNVVGSNFGLQRSVPYPTGGYSSDHNTQFHFQNSNQFNFPFSQTNYQQNNIQNQTNLQHNLYGSMSPYNQMSLNDMNPSNMNLNRQNNYINYVNRFQNNSSIGNLISNSNNGYQAQTNTNANHQLFRKEMDSSYGTIGSNFNSQNTFFNNTQVNQTGQYGNPISYPFTYNTNQEFIQNNNTPSLGNNQFKTGDYQTNNYGNKLSNTQISTNQIQSVINKDDFSQPNLLPLSNQTSNPIQIPIQNQFQNQAQNQAQNQTQIQLANQTQNQMESFRPNYSPLQQIPSSSTQQRTLDQVQKPMTLSSTLPIQFTANSISSNVGISTLSPPSWESSSQVTESTNSSPFIQYNSQSAGDDTIKENQVDKIKKKKKKGKKNKKKSKQEIEDEKLAQQLQEKILLEEANRIREEEIEKLRLIQLELERLYQEKIEQQKLEEEKRKLEQKGNIKESQPEIQKDQNSQSTQSVDIQSNTPNSPAEKTQKSKDEIKEDKRKKQKEFKKMMKEKEKEKKKKQEEIKKKREEELKKKKMEAEKLQAEKEKENIQFNETHLKVLRRPYCKHCKRFHNENEFSGEEDEYDSDSTEESEETLDPKDYYKILGVSIDANLQQIRNSYHDLKNKWTPDKFPDGSQQRLDAVSMYENIENAYKVLSDIDEKEKYDLGADDWGDVPLEKAPELFEIISQMLSKKPRSQKGFKIPTF